jgi:hypothetical protein
VDNRPDLVRHLRQSRRESSSSDIELIAASYEEKEIQTRRLQREALRELLPPAVATRTSKASFGQVWLREIDRHLPEASWSDSEVVKAGWVDLAESVAAMERTRTVMAGRMGGGKIIGMWGIVQTEAVVRALTIN